jgi:hypothetical protein
MPTVLMHILNEDPILGEIEKLPDPSDTIVILKNPRRKDGKDLYYLEANVTTAIWPISRLVLIEVMPTVEEEIIGFVRE